MLRALNICVIYSELCEVPAQKNNALGTMGVRLGDRLCALPRRSETGLPHLHAPLEYLPRPQLP